MKNKRHIDLAEIKKVTEMPCVACGISGEGYVCAHHVKSKGSGGGDYHYNLMPLCFKDHEEIHRGLTKFAKKHWPVTKWLMNKGWEFDKFSNRWRY